MPKRVDAIYCGFNKTSEHVINQKKTKSSLKPYSDAEWSQLLQFCNSSGSQPYTFLYPDHPDIQLFNIEKHKTTRKINISGENHLLGPTSCDDLNFLGHRLKGFYIIRQNTLQDTILKLLKNTQKLEQNEPH